MSLWRASWERFTPFLAFPPEIRTVIDTTDERIKRLPRNRGFSCGGCPGRAVQAGGAARRGSLDRLGGCRWQTVGSGRGAPRWVLLAGRSGLLPVTGEVVVGGFGLLARARSRSLRF